MNAPSGVGYCLAIAVLGLLTAAPLAQQPPALTGLDFILDTYVRDGYVYYRALKTDRRRLDSYLGQLAGVDANRLTKDEQIALWLNAYNALVLQTVVDHYPAPRRSNDYPPGSIRQTPGVFERLTHRVAGRTLTLDQIEQTVLPAFGDPRLYFAVGRGAVGGGRLRSESFTADGLERQLAEVAGECVTRGECIQIDAAANRLMASPIFSWREKDFVDAYAASAAPPYQARSPVERAILGFVRPKLLQTERDFLEKNTFEVAYKPFDWTLNDLTGRGDR
ncbi:MAG TPA: DUF547 domain-containing protein [Vicinamibacterales bacterium]|nr:DUF547 domain-containing protein [Vicinamibacterales bacterium]